MTSKSPRWASIRHMCFRLIDSDIHCRSRVTSNLLPVSQRHLFFPSEADAWCHILNLVVRKYMKLQNFPFWLSSSVVFIMKNIQFNWRKLSLDVLYWRATNIQYFHTTFTYSVPQMYGRLVRCLSKRRTNVSTFEYAILADWSVSSTSSEFDLAHVFSITVRLGSVVDTAYTDQLHTKHETVSKFLVSWIIYIQGACFKYFIILKIAYTVADWGMQISHCLSNINEAKCNISCSLCEQSLGIVWKMLFQWGNAMTKSHELVAAFVVAVFLRCTAHCVTLRLLQIVWSITTDWRTFLAVQQWNWLHTNLLALTSSGHSQISTGVDASDVSIYKITAFAIPIKSMRGNTARPSIRCFLLIYFSQTCSLKACRNTATVRSTWWSFPIRSVSRRKIIFS